MQTAAFDLQQIIVFHPSDVMSLLMLKPHRIGTHMTGTAKNQKCY